MPEIDETETVLRRFGAAIKRMRDRAGLTQMEAADRLADLFPDHFKSMSSQGYGQYERGRIKSVLEPSVQAMLAEALQGEADELRRWSEPTAQPPQLRVIDGMREREAPDFLVPLTTRARWADDASLAYDINRPDSKLDLSWLFTGHAGFIRMFSDTLEGRVSRGQTVVFDRMQSPLPGQLCVVETTTGESYVCVFRSRDAKEVRGEQLNPPATMEFNLVAVRGVYAVRLTGE